MIRTTGLKLAKSAVIQMRGSGYDAVKPMLTRGGKNIDFSVNMNKPYFRSPVSCNFSNMVPKSYSQRVSRDSDLARLL